MGRAVTVLYFSFPVSEVLTFADLERLPRRKLSPLAPMHSSVSSKTGSEGRSSSAERLPKPFQSNCVPSDLLVRTILVAAGFHQHDRGAWRHQHVKNPQTEATDIPASEESARLLDSAEKGDLTVLLRLRNCWPPIQSNWRNYSSRSSRRGIAIYR